MILRFSRGEKGTLLLNLCCKTVNFLSMCALKHIKKLANLQKIAIKFGGKKYLALYLHPLKTSKCLFSERNMLVYDPENQESGVYPPGDSPD